MPPFSETALILGLVLVSSFFLLRQQWGIIQYHRRISRRMRGIRKIRG